MFSDKETDQSAEKPEPLEMRVLKALTFIIRDWPSKPSTSNHEQTTARFTKFIFYATAAYAFFAIFQWQTMEKQIGAYKHAENALIVVTTEIDNTTKTVRFVAKNVGRGVATEVTGSPQSSQNDFLPGEKFPKDAILETVVNDVVPSVSAGIPLSQGESHTYEAATGPPI